MLSSVEGTYLRIPSETRKKMSSADTGEEVASPATLPKAREVTATSMVRLLRTKGHEAFLGEINEAELVELTELSTSPKPSPSTL